MSNHGVFSRVGFNFLVLFSTVFYATSSYAATAQSSATVSWASAFSGAGFFNSTYRAGANLTPPALTSSFDVLPSNAAPQSLNYGSAEIGASAFADGTSLIVESHATNGSAEVDASMTDLIFFEDLGAGVFSITADYTLSSFVVPTGGFSTVGITGSLEKFNDAGLSTGIVELDPIIQLDDTGLGTPNDLTGMLSLQIAFNENVDFYAVLNLNVFSVTNAVPVTPKTVPIPGGVALAIPALLPLFASRKRRRSNPKS